MIINYFLLFQKLVSTCLYFHVNPFHHTENMQQTILKSSGEIYENSLWSLFLKGEIAQVEHYFFSYNVFKIRLPQRHLKASVNGNWLINLLFSSLYVCLNKCCVVNSCFPTTLSTVSFSICCCFMLLFLSPLHSTLYLKAYPASRDFKSDQQTTFENTVTKVKLLMSNFAICHNVFNSIY